MTARSRAACRPRLLPPRVSLPLPPRTRSLPGPPAIVSAFGPPKALSHPKPSRIMSLPKPPQTTSLPAPAMIMSAPSVPTMTSSPSSQDFSGCLPNEAGGLTGAACPCLVLRSDWLSDGDKRCEHREHEQCRTSRPSLNRSSSGGRIVHGFLLSLSSWPERVARERLAKIDRPCRRQCRSSTPFDPRWPDTVRVE